jgi:hypothetical protein
MKQDLNKIICNGNEYILFTKKFGKNKVENYAFPCISVLQASTELKELCNEQIDLVRLFTTKYKCIISWYGTNKLNDEKELRHTIKLSNF